MTLVDAQGANGQQGHTHHGARPAGQQRHKVMEALLQVRAGQGVSVQSPAERPSLLTGRATMVMIMMMITCTATQGQGGQGEDGWHEWRKWSGEGVLLGWPGVHALCWLTFSTTKMRPRKSWPVEWPKPHRAPSALAAMRLRPMVNGVNACGGGQAVQQRQHGRRAGWVDGHTTACMTPGADSGRQSGSGRRAD